MPEIGWFSDSRDSDTTFNDDRDCSLILLNRMMMMTGIGRRPKIGCLLMPGILIPCLLMTGIGHLLPGVLISLLLMTVMFFFLAVPWHYS